MNWNLILTLSDKNLPPRRNNQKPVEYWKEHLSEDVFLVTRKHHTDRPFSSQMCTSFEPGLYGCSCCGELLFDSNQKFDSGTGWPSFSIPYNIQGIGYTKDTSFNMIRIEAHCNACKAHLGHVFPDGPRPSGLRFCINASSVNKIDITLKQLTLGGGCFWCTEAIFNRIHGVHKVISGYAGGEFIDPTYDDICSGKTGHAEVIQIDYDPNIISLGELVDIHLNTHDPTTLNRQGADVGTQYRSVIFYTNEEQKILLQSMLDNNQINFDQSIVTRLESMEHFYPAEAYHQQYYDRNNENRYCQVMIGPKLSKFKNHFASNSVS